MKDRRSCRSTPPAFDPPDDAGLRLPHSAFRIPPSLRAFVPSWLRASLAVPHSAFRTLPPFAILFVVLLAAPVSSAPIDPHNPPAGRFSDDWMEIYLAGQKVGYAHSTMTREGDVVHSSTTTVMQLGRVEQPIKVTVSERAVETLDGKPKSFESVQDLAVQKVVLKGAFEGDKVNIVSSQFGIERRENYELPAGARLKTWGGFRESLLRGFEPGTQYRMDLYEPSFRLDAPIVATTQIGDAEEFELRGRKIRGRKVTTTMSAPMGELKVLAWVDESGRPLLGRMPAPGLGDMEMVTVDQAKALAEFVPPELFMTTVVKAKRKIDYKNAQSIRYRLRTTHEHADLGEIPDTGGQRVTARGEGSVELLVTRARHQPVGGAAAAPSATNTAPASDGAAAARDPALAEYLDGNLMMNLDDAKLVALAKQAAGEEREPFALADRLRRFVSEYVESKNLNIGFATASEVARTREGDCSEHGVLLAALGRLNGLPSRVAVGLAYVPLFGRQDDIFGYHLWTQFYLDGRWIDFDAALNEPVCSPIRIAFAVSSLKSAGLADLSLPLLNKIGAIDIDILEIEPVSPGAGK